ncbi:MAG: PBP1A family penicillin-binding protein [Deltaproteobacteria bacterium]|nr:MAG: PBP1A family penicillin-binding protein [Deltaproteobacteria bacterium]
MRKLIKISLAFFAVALLLITSMGIALWYLWSSNLPYIGSLKDYNPPIITEVYADDGQTIGQFRDERRILVPLEEISNHMINAFIAAEDDRFFQHRGIDLLSIVRALFKNIKAGRIEQGGSTITQQVTKSLLLKNPARTYKRKVREALLSLQIEREFSKEEILYRYLNQIYLGHSLYGIEAASKGYFGKKASELNIAESALLAGLAQAPSRDSPIKHLERAKLRQKYVLERMKTEGFIDDKEFEEALNTELEIQPSKEQSAKKVPYFLEHIRQIVERKYGRHLLYNGGLKIHTTVNLPMQIEAKNAIQMGLNEFDKREGFRGPIRRVSPDDEAEFDRQMIEKLKNNPLEIGLITEGIVAKVDSRKKQTLVRIGDQTGLLPLSGMTWARKVDPEKAYSKDKLKNPADVLASGDIILVKVIKKTKGFPGWILSLEQTPEAQAALLCLDAKTGYVKALVGGLDFSKSQFNRATQARRQPGSAFKPIIYAAALDKGFTPSSMIIDAPFISPIAGEEEEERLWKPRNYKEKFYGPTLFRTGLIQSRNIITIKILKKIGIHYAINYARRMGIESPLSADLSLALGSSGLSLLQLTRAYSVFANDGMLVEPIFITKIVDRNGKILEENQTSFAESISQDTAYVMTDLLKAVVKEGTGWRVRALKRPVAGKTGTTDDLRDAWFIGFNPSLVVGVWLGYDDRRPMGIGETGSRAASPIWLYFMREILKEKPKIPFQYPEDVVITKIDAKTGLLASPYSKKTCFQAFKKGTEPTVYSPKPDRAKPGEFFQLDMDYSGKSK